MLEGAVLAGITRVNVADYVYALIWVYILLVFANVLLSWLPRPPDSPAVKTLVRFVRDLTDPYLRAFRRVVPPMRVGNGILDLSPVVGFIVLWLAGQLIPPIIAG